MLGHQSTMLVPYQCFMLVSNPNYLKMCTCAYPTPAHPQISTPQIVTPPVVNITSVNTLTNVCQHFGLVLV